METLANFKTGKHLAKIIDAKLCFAEKHFEWDDLTLVLELCFQIGKRTIKKYYNLLGYKKYHELTNKEMQSGQFLKSKTGDYALKSIWINGKEFRFRIICKHRTKMCLQMIKLLAKDFGINNNEDFCLENFIGKEAEIYVIKKSFNSYAVERVRAIASLLKDASSS